MSKRSVEKLLIIHADQRERGSGVIEALRRFPDTRVEVTQLLVGDYVLSGDVAIERKTSSDFVLSILDKRLFSQIKRLQDAFSQPLLIVEGPSLFDRPALHPNALRGALSYIQVLQRIPILHTRDAEDTAEYLHIVARHVQHGLGYEISLHRKPKASNPQAQQRYVLESVPGVGPKLAVALLDHLGSLERVFLAEQDALCQVSGVGTVTARNIRSLMSLAYEPPPDKQRTE